MYNNPYQMYQPRYPQQMPIQQPIVPQTEQYVQPSLPGKKVESIDVVRTIDIPLDGSISYFVLADNSAIVTKQLQTDGKSKMVVYRPVEEKPEPKVSYATIEDLEDLKDELKDIRLDLKDLRKKKKED